MTTQTFALSDGTIEFRHVRRGERTVVLLHGGHMHAGVELGEQVFADAGFSTLVPSRPGYGRTSRSTGQTPAQFADAVAEVAHRLGIVEVAAVVGVSAGGPAARELAARHAVLVRRLILQSAVSSMPWPDRLTRRVARVAFHSKVQGFTWAMARRLLRANPERALTLLLGNLSTEPGGVVLQQMDDNDRERLRQLVATMNSGRGFEHDIRVLSDLRAPVPVTQPTLVMASRSDRAVPFAHAEHLCVEIPRAELHESYAPCHLLWFGPHTDRDEAAISEFMQRPVAAVSEKLGIV